MQSPQLIALKIFFNVAISVKIVFEISNSHYGNCSQPAKTGDKPKAGSSLTANVEFFAVRDFKLPKKI